MNDSLTPDQKDEAWNTPQADTTGDSFSKYSPKGASDVRPARQVLHELITQLITERKLPNNGQPYSERLEDFVASTRELPAYRAFQEKAVNGGGVSRQDISSMLDFLKVEKLPNAPEGQRTAVLISGSPASGKTALGKFAVSQFFSDDMLENSIRYNPDDFRPILAPREDYGTRYSGMSQAENKILADSIMSRIAENTDIGIKPNVFMDVLTVSKPRMQVLQQADNIISVTGTAPTEVTVERAWARGQTDRILPTEVTVGAGKWVAGHTPDILTLATAQNKSLEFYIHDTNVAPGTAPKLVAAWRQDATTIDVHEPDTFVNFIERANINEKANHPQLVYSNEAVTTPEANYANLKSYLDKGVKIDFLTPEKDVAISFSKDGTVRNSTLTSARGEDFFNRMALAGGADMDPAMTERLKAQAAAPPESKFAPYKPTAGQVSTISTAQAGFDAFAAFMSGKGFVQAYENHDNKGMALNGANFTTSALSLGANINSGLKGLPVNQGLTGALGKVNIGLTVANIAYQVNKEDGTYLHRDENGAVDGLGHKGERLIAATAGAAPSLVVAGATTTGLVTTTGVAGAGLAATGTAVLSTVVLPAVVIIGSAYVIGKATDTIIDTRRTYEKNDIQVDKMSAARKYRDTVHPSLGNYAQCVFCNARFSDIMRDDQLNGKIERNGPKSGNRVTNFTEVDFSDPKNLAEYKHMLDVAEAREKQIVKDNSSRAPRWLRSDDKILKEESAKADLKMIAGARKEIEMFEKEAATFNAAQGLYQETVKLHKDTAAHLSENFGATEDPAARRSALNEFLAGEEQVRKKAEGLPEGLQRKQLIMESNANSASVRLSLASLAENPKEAIADMEKAQELMKTAGLDPAKEQSYEAIGIKKADFDQRLALYHQQADAAANLAAPVPAPNGQTATGMQPKGYLSDQFANGGTGNTPPATAHLTTTKKQPEAQKSL